jgi:hypothetical protein
MLQIEGFIDELVGDVREMHAQFTVHLAKEAAPLALQMQQAVGEILSISLTPVSLTLEKPPSHDLRASLAQLISKGPPPNLQIFLMQETARSLMTAEHRAVALYCRHRDTGRRAFQEQI